MRFWLWTGEFSSDCHITFHKNELSEKQLQALRDFFPIPADNGEFLIEFQLETNGKRLVVDVETN